MTTARPFVISVYDRLIAAHPDLQRKGKTTAYTAINGNMFSFVGPDGEMCLRLSPEDTAVFGETWDIAPVIRYKSVMRGYVAVSAALLRDEATLAQWFAKAVSHARTLKPKPTTRRK